MKYLYEEMHRVRRSLIKKIRTTEKFLFISNVFFCVRATFGIKQNHKLNSVILLQAYDMVFDVFFLNQCLKLKRISFWNASFLVF
jgi:hypothetical protein